MRAYYVYDSDSVHNVKIDIYIYIHIQRPNGRKRPTKAIFMLISIKRKRIISEDKRFAKAAAFLFTINDMHGNVRLCLQLTHIYLINVVVVDFVVFFSTSLFLFSSLSLLPAPVVLMRFLFALFVCIDGVSALFGTLNTRLRTHHWQCQHLTNIVNSISNSRCLHEIQIITHN